MKFWRGIAAGIAALVLLFGAGNAWAALTLTPDYNTGIGPITGTGPFTANLYYIEGARDLELGIALKMQGTDLLSQNDWDNFKAQLSSVSFDWRETDGTTIGALATGTHTISADINTNVIGGMLGLKLTPVTGDTTYVCRIIAITPNPIGATGNSLLNLPLEVGKLTVTSSPLKFQLRGDTDMPFMKGNTAAYTTKWELLSGDVAFIALNTMDVEIKNGTGNVLIQADDAWKSDTTDSVSGVMVDLPSASHSIRLHTPTAPTAVKPRQTITIEAKDIVVLESSQGVKVALPDPAPTVSFDTVISEYTLSVTPDRIAVPTGEVVSEDITVQNADFGVQNLKLFDGATEFNTATEQWNGLSFDIVDGNKIQVKGTPTAQETKTFTVTANPTKDPFTAVSGVGSFTVAVGDQVVTLSLNPANVPVPAGANFNQTVSVSANNNYAINDITLSYGDQIGAELSGISGLTVKADSATKQITISGTPDSSVTAKVIDIKVSAKSPYGVVTDATLTITIAASTYTLSFTPTALTLRRGEAYEGGTVTATLKHTAGEPAEISRLAINGQTGETVWRGLTLKTAANQITISGTPTIAGLQRFTVQAWTKNAAGTEEEAATATLLLTIEEPGIAGTPGELIVIDDVRVNGAVNGTVPVGSGTSILLPCPTAPDGTPFSIELIAPDGKVVWKNENFTSSGGRVLVSIGAGDLTQAGRYYLRTSYLQNQTQYYQRIPFEVRGSSDYNPDDSSGCSTVGWGFAALGLCAAILRKKS